MGLEVVAAHLRGGHDRLLDVERLDRHHGVGRGHGPLLGLAVVDDLVVRPFDDLHVVRVPPRRRHGRVEPEQNHPARAEENSSAPGSESPSVRPGRARGAASPRAPRNSSAPPGRASSTYIQHIFFERVPIGGCAARAPSCYTQPVVRKQREPMTQPPPRPPLVDVLGGFLCLVLIYWLSRSLGRTRTVEESVSGAFQS